MVASIIFVLNARYFVQTNDSQPVGASSFVSAAARSLKEAGHHIYFVLMRHDLDLLAPHLDVGDFEETGTISVGYNFGMNASEIKAVFQDIEHLVKVELPARPAWFWHQSLVFLKFQPPHTPGSVTCHAPFVVEVERTLGNQGAISAFNGGQSKLDFLRREQSAGLNSLIRNDELWSWEFSSLQTHLLKSFGVPQHRLLKIPSHLSSFSFKHVRTTPMCFESDRPLSAEATTFFTAAARNDGFKALGDLILAHDYLIERKIRCCLEIFVGDRENDRARESLNRLVTSEQSKFVSILPRLPQDELLRRMTLYALHRAIFVFPSLYETYGLTAVQASLCGLPVLLRNEESRIGCLSDLKDAITFKGGYTNLAKAMTEAQKLSDLPRTTLQDEGNLAAVIQSHLVLAT